MKFTVILEPGEDGKVVANCPTIPGCWSQGKTDDEAIENIKPAIRLCLDVRSQEGLPQQTPRSTGQQRCRNSLP
ncbi:MAG: type II toxin-antitoxin system HicB family antitoxin [Dehalococcoidia bacterium]|nr:type II toxin-antitoxin system HicB family antitoxin [Dehalococcoidia bacterium]